MEIHNLFCFCVLNLHYLVFTACLFCFLWLLKKLAGFAGVARRAIQEILMYTNLQDKRAVTQRNALLLAFCF